MLPLILILTAHLSIHSVNPSLFWYVPVLDIAIGWQLAGDYLGPFINGL